MLAHHTAGFDEEANLSDIDLSAFTQLSDEGSDKETTPHTPKIIRKTTSLTEVIQAHMQQQQQQQRQQQDLSLSEEDGGDDGDDAGGGLSQAWRQYAWSAQGQGQGQGQREGEGESETKRDGHGHGHGHADGDEEDIALPQFDLVLATYTLSQVDSHTSLALTTDVFCCMRVRECIQVTQHCCAAGISHS
jgi:hypothetical protein